MEDEPSPYFHFHIGLRAFLSGRIPAGFDGREERGLFHGLVGFQVLKLKHARRAWGVSCRTGG